MPRRQLVATALAVAAILFLCLNCLFGDQDRVGVSREDAPGSFWPIDATDINYHSGAWPDPNSYCDFATSEQGFVAFAAARGLPLVGPIVGPTRAIRWDHATQARVEVEIEDGVGYGWSKEDAGRSWAYDRRAGRAYSWGHYR